MYLSTLLENVERGGTGKPSNLDPQIQSHGSAAYITKGRLQ